MLPDPQLYSLESVLRSHNDVIFFNYSFYVSSFYANNQKYDCMCVCVRALSARNHKENPSSFIKQQFSNEHMIYEMDWLYLLYVCICAFLLYLEDVLIPCEMLKRVLQIIVNLSPSTSNVSLWYIFHR